MHDRNELSDHEAAELYRLAVAHRLLRHGEAQGYLKLNRETGGFTPLVDGVIARLADDPNDLPPEREDFDAVRRSQS